MNKSEAQRALQAGHKVTHRFFTDEEFIEQVPGTRHVRDENGYKLTGHGREFWDARQGDQWLNGWEIFEEESKEPTRAMTDDERAKVIADLVNKFDHGDYRFHTSPLFNQVIQMLVREVSEIEIIGQLISRAEDSRIALETHLLNSPQNHPGPRMLKDLDKDMKDPEQESRGGDNSSEKKEDI